MEFVSEDLLSLLQGRRGHFKLESGHHGDFWLQLETLCLKPREIAGFASRLAAKLDGYKVDVVCGPLVEGAFVALLVSQELGCEFVYTERIVDETREGLYPVVYRLPEALRPAVEGKKVAIANDVINAGSAVCGTFFELESFGVKPVAIGALLAMGGTIGEFAAAHEVPLELLNQMPNNLWTPAECPLCKNGEPLEIVGTS